MGANHNNNWRTQANCRGIATNLFYPERIPGEANLAEPTARQAKEVCRGCTVRTECLEYALANHEDWGIWGGTSLDERRALKKARKNQARRARARHAAGAE